MNDGTVVISGPLDSRNGAIDYDGNFIMNGGELFDSADNVLDVFRHMRRGLAVAAEVRLLGFAEYSPWSDVMQHLLMPDSERLTVRDCYEVGMAWLEVSDAVLVVEGWTMSHGTQAEIARAEELDIPVFYSIGTLLEWSNER